MSDPNEPPCAKPPLSRNYGSALIAEVRAIITDQINRHVAMQDTHRAWVAKDIADRVCGLIAPCEACAESRGSTIYRHKDGKLETPTGKHAARKAGGFVVVVDGKHYQDRMWLEPWEARELASLLLAAANEWFPDSPNNLVSPRAESPPTEPCA